MAEPSLRDITARNHREMMTAQGISSGLSASLQMDQIDQNNQIIAQNAEISRQLDQQRKLAESTLQAQLESKGNQERAAFALWRQTPDGARYLDWRSRALAVIELVDDRNAAWAEACVHDAAHALTEPEQRALEFVKRVRPSMNGVAGIHVARAAVPNSLQALVRKIALWGGIGGAVYWAIGILSWFFLWTGAGLFAYLNQNSGPFFWAIPIGGLIFGLSFLIPKNRAEKAREAELAAEYDQATSTAHALSTAIAPRGVALNNWEPVVTARWTAADTNADKASLLGWMDWAFTNHPTLDELPPVQLPQLVGSIPSNLPRCQQLLDMWGQPAPVTLELEN